MSIRTSGCGITSGFSRGGPMIARAAVGCKPLFGSAMVRTSLEVLLDQLPDSLDHLAYVLQIELVPFGV